jgi:hypothetical protein
MEALLLVIAVIFLSICNVLISYTLAWLLTEVRPIPWRVKPFSCRGCLSFWLTLFFELGIGAALPLPGDAEDIFCASCMVGLVLGLINYLYIKSKFQIYE